MRKLLTVLTALTLVGGISLSAPQTTVAADRNYWISTASVGDGTSCASPTHEYDAADPDKQLNDLLDDILADIDAETDIVAEDYTSAIISICDADEGAQQVYEMDADTSPVVDVAGAEITVAGVQWDATSEADVADAGDVVIDGNEDYSPFEFNNADVYIGYLTILFAFDDDTGAAIHFEQDSPDFIFELNLDHVVINGAFIGDGDGAGVYAEGSVTIADSTFTNNRANNGSGGAVFVTDAVAVTISGSVFGNPDDAAEGNDANSFGANENEGGDIYVTGGNGLAELSISNSQFYDAQASRGGSIAAICAASVINGITIRGAEADGELVPSMDGDGAGMYFNDGSGCGTDYTVTVTNSRFLNNDADYQGGAISDGQDLSNSLTEVIVSRSYFYQNEAEYGAAINLDWTTLRVSNSTFIENHAVEQGGVLEVCNNAAVTITGSRFEGNTANDDGGVIRQSCGLDSLRLIGNTFTQNEAGSDGGVVFIDGFSGESTFIATSNKFIGNLAEDHGGVFGVYLNSSARDSSFLRGLRRNTYRGNRADADRDRYGQGGILMVSYDNFDARSPQRRLESALQSGNTIRGARVGLVYQIND